MRGSPSGSFAVAVSVTVKGPVPDSGAAPRLIVGGALTLKTALAGVGSSLPARSRAFTSKAWETCASPVRVAVVADENSVKAPPSRRHAKTRLAGGVWSSLPVNVIVAVVSLITAAGALVMRVNGGVLSAVPEPGCCWHAIDETRPTNKIIKTIGFRIRLIAAPPGSESDGTRRLWRRTQRRRSARPRSSQLGN